MVVDTQRSGCPQLSGSREPPRESGRLWLGKADEGRHLHCPCRGKVPHQMDCTGRSRLQQVLNKIRCLGWDYFLSMLTAKVKKHVLTINVLIVIMSVTYSTCWIIIFAFNCVTLFWDCNLLNFSLHFYNY